jgi:hypothetical protein
MNESRNTGVLLTMIKKYMNIPPLFSEWNGEGGEGGLIRVGLN